MPLPYTFEHTAGVAYEVCRALSLVPGVVTPAVPARKARFDKDPTTGERVEVEPATPEVPASETPPTPWSELRGEPREPFIAAVRSILFDGAKEPVTTAEGPLALPEVAKTFHAVVTVLHGR